MMEGQNRTLDILISYNFFSILLYMDATLNTDTTVKKFHLKATGTFVDAQVENAIRKGNVKSFIRKGVSSSDFNGNEPDENASLSQHLLQLKGSCSDLNKQIRTKETDTAKYRDETTFAADKSRKIKEERQRLEEKIRNLQSKLDTISMKKNSALHSFKTYEHILDRMKKDDITYQLRKNELQRQLNALQKKYKYIQAQNYSAIEMERLGYHGLKDAQEEHEEQKKNRKIQLQTANETIAKKKENMEKMKERQKKTQQIQEMAAGDLQDAQLLRLKKFLTVQIFLKSLLKCKISKLKANYEPYELAFYQIKSHTNVKDSSSLKHEFFNFQNNYNEKTAWVKHLEMEIEDAEKQKKQLEKKLHETMDIQLRMLEQFQDKETEEKTINKNELNMKSMQYDLAMKKVEIWFVTQARKLGMVEEINGLGNNEIFKKICEKLKKGQEGDKELGEVEMKKTESQTIDKSK